MNALVVIIIKHWNRINSRSFDDGRVKCVWNYSGILCFREMGNDCFESEVLNGACTKVKLDTTCLEKKVWRKGTMLEEVDVYCKWNKGRDGRGGEGYIGCIAVWRRPRPVSVLPENISRFHPRNWWFDNIPVLHKIQGINWTSTYHSHDHNQLFNMQLCHTSTHFSNIRMYTLYKRNYSNSHSF